MHPSQGNEQRKIILCRVDTHKFCFISSGLGSWIYKLSVQATQKKTCWKTRMYLTTPFPFLVKLGRKPRLRTPKRNMTGDNAFMPTLSTYESSLELLQIGSANWFISQGNRGTFTWFGEYLWRCIRSVKSVKNLHQCNYCEDL